MQCVVTPEGDSWPALLSLNAANDWERQLLEVLQYRTLAPSELSQGGMRLNITLEPKIAEEEAAPEAPAEATSGEGPADTPS